MSVCMCTALAHKYRHTHTYIIANAYAFINNAIYFVIITSRVLFAVVFVVIVVGGCRF